jgi:hypothetical protein
VTSRKKAVTIFDPLALHQNCEGRLSFVKVFCYSNDNYYTIYEITNEFKADVDF